jgi:AAA domain, putative AbiEii toxin, Type IV TA system
LPTGDSADPEANIQQIMGLRLEYSWNAVSRAKPTTSIARVVVKGKELEFEPADDSDASLIRGVFATTAVIGSGTLERFNSIQLKKRTDDVINVLRAVDASIESVVIGSNEVISCDVGLPDLIPVNLLGDGLVRLLAVISAIVDMEGGVVFLDEVETGLHYSAFPALWTGIFEAASRFSVQVFASTHSLEFVRAFSSTAEQEKWSLTDDIRLYRVERQNGAVVPTTYTPGVLATSLEEDWEVR